MGMGCAGSHGGTTAVNAAGGTLMKDQGQDLNLLAMMTSDKNNILF